MLLTRRSALAAAATLPLLNISAILRAAEPDLSGLANIAAGTAPIGEAERRARIARAQGLMKANGIGAVLIEAGSSLIYFTGVRWGRSERLTMAVLPVEGEPCIITPFFEEPSIRQTLVRTEPRLGAASGVNRVPGNGSIGGAGESTGMTASQSVNLVDKEPATSDPRLSTRLTVRGDDDAALHDPGVDQLH